MLCEPKPMDFRVRRLWRFSWTWRILRPKAGRTPAGRIAMGLLDKLLGRGKKAAGDMMGDSSMRREGAAQEREAAAQDRAEQHEEMAQEQRQQAAEAHTERENT